MTVKKRIIIVVFSLLLLVAASFAWINESQNTAGRFMSFLFRDNQAVITSIGIDVKLYYDKSGNDEFVDMTNKFTPDGENQLHDFSDFAPGDQKKFRADVVNNSDTPLSLRMVLSNIVCENRDMREQLEIGTSGFEGFPATTLTPRLEGKTLSQGLNDGNFVLVENVEIPPNGKTVSIYFYVMFSRDATEALADQHFTIGSINFMAI